MPSGAQPELWPWRALFFGVAPLAPGGNSPRSGKERSVDHKLCKLCMLIDVNTFYRYLMSPDDI